MANVKLASKAVGDVVKLKVNGVAKEFIVVHQGLPSSLYDASCDGTWLLMKDIYEKKTFNSSNLNAYETSEVNTYLNGPFFSLFDSNIQGIIKQVKIPHVKNGVTQSGANGLSCKVFLLSGPEVGLAGSSDYMQNDGAKLDYFNANTGADSKRIAYLNGSATIWWLRSPYTYNSQGVWTVTAEGTGTFYNAFDYLGIRPALILPFNMEVDDSGNVVPSTRPMKLSEMPVGGTVSINVNGAAKDFLVVHQGKPSSLYDNSCDGTWLLMKDIYENRQWHNPNINSYKESAIHSYLNSTFLNLFESNIQAAIKQVKIPYVNEAGSSAVASGANGLSCKVFLLSGYEVGIGGKTYLPQDGAKLSYFNLNIGTDPKRIAYLNGSASSWWLRSPSTNSVYYAWNVNSGGSCDNGFDVGLSFGIRPALVLPSTLLVSDDGTVSTNTPPTITSTSGASGVNLGSKSAAFSFKYTPNDADGDKLTVTEKLDGVVMKTRTNVTSGTQLTFECASTADGFQQILNGSHVITIEVNDGTESVTFTANFSKAVYEASIALNEPFAVAGDITVAVMNIVGELPSDAVLKVEVTNNAKDDSPVWQDATDEVLNGRNIAFLNNTAVNGAAFSFRMSVKRGASNTGGYINTITGAFQ